MDDFLMVLIGALGFYLTSLGFVMLYMSKRAKTKTGKLIMQDIVLEKNEKLVIHLDGTLTGEEVATFARFLSEQLSANKRFILVGRGIQFQKLRVNGTNPFAKGTANETAS